jgi:ATP-binding cassette subfamily B multidrug efflux pump
MSSGLEGYIEQDEALDSRNVRLGSVARLFRMIGGHRGAMAIGVLTIGIGTFAALLEPRLFGYAIDEAIIPMRWNALVRLGVAYLVIVVVRVAAVIAQGYLFEYLGQRVTQDLRVQLFSHLQRLPVSTFDKQPAGRLLTRVTNDVASLNEMFSAGFVSIVSNSLMVLGILVWLMVLDLKLGLIAASVFPFLIAASVYFSRLLRGAYRDSRSRLSALNAFLAENLNGMKVVNLFNRQKLHLERFDRVNQWYTDSLISTIRVYAVFQPTITVASGISVALVIGFGGQQVLHGSLKLGVLVAFFSYVLTLFQPVREIADKWNIFLSGMISAERIFAILAWPTELEASDDRRKEVEPIEELRGHIVFENVWFAYEGDSGSERWILKDFSLEIQPGMRVGVVGHTGAGKTTLISLLMRFYEPQRGRILLDGKDIRAYDKRRLRASIGIIQQDAFVFSGTLKDNVTFWRDEASPGAMAARKALAGMGFERWWSSDDALTLRERGSNLSMGEKQVLAFARAIAGQPRIWILDEATANMDSQTEESLQRSLEEASQSRTSILIAHRLATVKAADVILVLHRGALQEKGSHTELLALNGLYARLYRYQEAQEAVAEAVARAPLPPV